MATKTSTKVKEAYENLLYIAGILSKEEAEKMKRRIDKIRTNKRIKELADKQCLKLKEGKINLSK